MASKLRKSMAIETGSFSEWDFPEAAYIFLTSQDY
jgi:hypothetical protein